MPLPLHGIRVLDVTNVLAGPFSSFQLVLLGAEVIKIEHPENGDLARRLGADSKADAALMGASFVAVNASKQSVTLNLKAPEGKEIFKQLAAISPRLRRRRLHSVNIARMLTFIPETTST